MEEFSDEQLIKNYLSGQPLALEELIARYFKQIFFFAKTFVKQDQEAEDITQEVFVKVWKNIKKFKPEKKFKSWLFQIAKNTSLDFLRKNKKLLAADSIQQEQMARFLDRAVDLSPLPGELFDTAGFEKQLDEILSALPENYKLAVILHLQQGLTFLEMSDVLNESLNTIKSRYRRALLMVRKNIGENNHLAPKS